MREFTRTSCQRARSVLVALTAMAAALVIAISPLLLARPGGSGWPVLAADFDRGKAAPDGNLADLGELFTYTQAGTSWEKVAGESGPSEGAFLLTSEGGDPGVEYGLLGSFEEFPRQGTLGLSFDVTPSQKNAILDNVICGERGVDILGLRFDRDGRVRVLGTSQMAPYKPNHCYRVDMTLVLGYGQQVAYDVMVTDLKSGEPIGIWTGMASGELPVGARWSKPAGSGGSFILDDFEAWWTDQGE